MKASRLVVDASVVLKWLVRDIKKEPETEQALELRKRIYQGDLLAEVPAFFWVEAANFLARAGRPVAALRSLEMFLDSEPTLPPARLERAYEMVWAEIHAGHRKATLYNALYAELALFRRCALLTADRFQFDMARRAGAEAVLLKDFS